MRTRRIWAFILALTIFMGNTMSVSATSSTISGNDIVDIEKEEVVEEEVVEDENVDSVDDDPSEEISDNTSTDENEDKELIEGEKELLEELPKTEPDENVSVSGNEVEAVLDENTTVSGNELEVEEEIPVLEAPEPMMTEVAGETESGPIYGVYWGLPSVLAPTMPSSTTDTWTGDKISGLGRQEVLLSGDEVYYENSSWKILDPEEGLLGSSSIFYKGVSYSDEAEAESAFNERYLKTGVETFFSDRDKYAIEEMRLLTKEEMTNPAYGFNNTEEADSTRALKYYELNTSTKYNYQLANEDGEEVWVTHEGQISSSPNYSYGQGQAPAMVLNTEKVFLTVYNEFNSYYAVQSYDYSDVENRVWNLVFKTDDTGFDAEIPETVPFQGTLEVNVTSLAEKYAYDGISMTMTDETGNLVVYEQMSGHNPNPDSYNPETYESAPALGTFDFYLPEDLMPGEYTIRVFEEHEDNRKDGCDTVSNSAYVSNYVEQKIEVVGPTVTGLSIKQVYGEVQLRWEIANKRTENFGTYTYCDIYRSESPNEGYVLIETEDENGYPCHNTNSSYTWADTSILDEETGQNKSYYYKVVIAGEEIDTVTPLTNEGLPYRSLTYDVQDYKRIYIGERVENDGKEDYTELTSITMRPEEYKELYLVMEKEDGSKIVEEIVSQDQNGYSSDSISWYLCSSAAMGSSVSDAQNKEVTDAGLEFLPIEEDVEWKLGFFECSEKFTAGNTYFLFVQRGISGIGRFWVQVPVVTADAAQGETYTKTGDTAGKFFLSPEALSQAMRDDMVARKSNGTYYVSQDAYYQWGGQDEMYDFSAEREGMLPEEGDYLRWQCFDPVKVVDHREGWLVETPVYFNGKEWWKIELDQVYYTTAAQEAAVTEKIDYILTKGGLKDLWDDYYRADGNYTTEQRKIIADACCQYVYDNVNYIGTVTPKYHSAWSAIVNGTGTCQAYALFYTRLLREFGIVTKILTGTDKNYHTYNIVQIDADKDEWYYYDATGNIKYKTESQFSRTKYQDMFVDNSLFIQNYISKIVGSPYEAGIHLYGDGELIGKYFEMNYAVSAMYEDVEKEGREDTKYTIKLVQDAIMTGHYALAIDGVAYCEVDLNGHKLTLANGAEFHLDCLKNGTLYQPLSALPNKTIFGCSWSNNTAIYENLTLNIQYSYGELYMDSRDDLEDDQVICRNIHTNEISNFYAVGNVYMDEDSAITVLNATEIYGEGDEHDLALLGKITTEELFAYGKIDIGSLIVNGRAYEVGSDSYLYKYINRDYESAVINIYDELNVKGHLGIFTANRSAEDTTKQDMQFNLVQTVDGTGNDKVLKTGKMVVGSEGLNVNFDYAGILGSVVFGKKVMRKTGDTLEDLGYVKFDSGETMVTMKASEELVPLSGIKMYQSEEKDTIIRSGYKLIAARTTVNVSHTNAENVTTTKEYTSLESAISSLAGDFGSDKGIYTFSFVEDAKMNATVTIPSFVQKALLCAEAETEIEEGGEEQDTTKTLDFNGYSISASTVVEVDDTLNCINTSSTASKWNLTGANGSDGYVIKVNGDMSDVSITAAKGTIALISDDGTVFYNIDAALSAAEVAVVTGKWNLNTVTATTFTNEAVAYVGTLKNVTTLNNIAGSVFVADTYTQKTAGKTNLEAGSEFAILASGTVYNTVLGGMDTSADGLVYVYTLADSKVSFETKVSAVNDNVQMSFGHILSSVTNETGEIIEALDGVGIAEQLVADTARISAIAPRTKIFTSKISTFPVDLIDVNQPEDSSYSKTYEEVYQDSTGIYVGREWITIYTKQVNGDEEPMKSFIRWSDAAAYLNTLANTQMEYVVEIAEDIEMTTALTLPAKVKGITFRGAAIETIDENEEPVTPRVNITYTGDLKLLSDTTFENVNLIAKKYNSKTKDYDDYKSALNLNGKVLTLDNVQADFTSITGNAKAYVDMSDSDISVAKTVSSLGFLVMDDSNLEATGNIAVTDTLTMASSELVSSAAISLKNVITNDAHNSITYGGNGSKNILTITGNVTSNDESDETVWVENAGENGNGAEVTVRKNAIRLSVKALENSGYVQNALLCNAAKAGAGWFVIGTDWEERTVNEETKTVRVISYGTYKKNNAIYCGEIVENVKLYSYNPVENSAYELGNEAEYIWESSFATLQEAFSEIDKLALSDRYYLIELKADDENVVTYSNKALTFPAKTRGIMVSASGDGATANIYFKGGISLKSDALFEGVVFVPTAATSVSLGNYQLTLSGCDVDTSKAAGGFNKFTGSGVTGTSVLTLMDTDLTVTGAVSGIGTLVYAVDKMEDEEQIHTTMQPKLTANGAITVGDVVLKTDGELVGLATVTRKNGVVTKVTPQLTISGEVYSGTKDVPDNENTLYLDLQEVVSKKYVPLDFDKSEMEDILDSGLMLAKAVNVTYPNIKAMQRTGEENSLLIKSAGYLTYFEGGYGAELFFEENGDEYIIPCRTFADAVTEINNRKIKRDYTITLTKDMAEISGADQNSSNEVPKALSMPNKNYVDLLTIQADPDALVPDANGRTNAASTKLGFLNNITLTSNVILDNVQFVQMVKAGSAYQVMDVAKDNYPAAMTLNTAGFELCVVGDVTFNTPLILNGGSKGSLAFDENGTITTLTNDYIGGEEKNVIYGTITSFASLDMDGVDLVLNEYRSARDSSKYTASSSSITTVNMNEASITIVGEHAKGAFSNTNLNMDNSSLIVGGKVNLKNVTLEGDQKAAVAADTDFNITGTLTSRTNNAALTTRLKGSGKAPYLNISGTVVRVDDSAPICVEVYNENGALVKEHVTLTNAPKVTAQLLTAKNAAARDFTPHVGNYSGGEYSESNTKGYMMFKSGSNIYVYSGNQVYAAVYTGEDELVGYYPSQKDAVAAINALKDKTQDYSIVLMQENGTVASPTAITVPSYADTVTIRSLNEECENVYLSGSITLNAKTVLKDLTFIPVNKGKATTFSIAAGNYDLTLTDVKTSNGGMTSGTAALKDISGKGKQTITWESPALIVTGSINSANKLIVNENAQVNGTLKASALQLNNTAAVENNPASAVTLTTKGTVTIGNIENRGTLQNIFVFGRNSKNATNLTINKEISNENAILLLKQTEGSEVAALSKDGYKVALSDAKKLAVMPLASTDSFDVAGRENSQVLVKANKGIYLADSTATVDIVVLTRAEPTLKTTKINCLDYTQAINEINNLADMDSSYVVELAAGTDAAIGADTNVTDGNPYGAFPMPSANKAKSVVIDGTVGEGLSAASARMSFTGGISGYGTVTIQNVMLNPVKKSTDDTPVDVKISCAADKTAAMASLTLINVKTLTQTAETSSTTGFIASISGTKNKTNVELQNCGSLIMKSGISNVNEFTLTGTKLLSGGASTVNTTVLGSGSSWDSLGKLTTNYVTMPVDNTAYIGIKQDKNANPQFVLNNDVNGAGLLICKVYNVATALADDEAIFAGNSENEAASYKSVSLVSAKKASADKVRAFTFRPANAKEGAFADGGTIVPENKLISYKVGAYVRNGNIDDMAVRVSQYEGSLSGDLLSTFYAESFDACTTIINNIADTNAYYDIEFIQAPTGNETQVVIMTTKNGTAYGAWTMPSKAAGLTIRGHVITKDDLQQNATVVKYTGTLKASCDVTLEDIYLTEGKTDKKALDGFKENGSITPAPANNKAIIFTDSVFTVEDDEALEKSIEDELVFAFVNSSKGELVLDKCPVTVNGAMTIGTLQMEDGITVDAGGKISITNLYADEEDNHLSSPAAITIGNVVNSALKDTEDAGLKDGAKDNDTDGKVVISTCFTKIKKTGTYGSSQLTISGLINDAKVQIEPMSYDLVTASYQEMTQAQIENLLVGTAVKPDSYRRFAVIPKASLENVMLAAKDVAEGNVLTTTYSEYDELYSGDIAQKYLYKYETGLYLTNLLPIVEVVGYMTSDGNGAYAEYSDTCYHARFLSWDQAVKEIDKIGNNSRYYEMILLDTIGYEDAINSPIGTVTMPAKAAQVTITSERGEENGIFFTGLTITAKCPTLLKNVGFTGVKKYGKGTSAYFEPITFTFSIGNYHVIMTDMTDSFCGEETVPYTVSGSSKGILECSTANKDVDDSITYAAIKSISDLVITEDMTVNCEGDLNIKNLIVTEGSTNAKNITVGTKAALDEAYIQAGTDAIGSGKMTFKDIVLADSGNRLTAKQDKNGKSMITINGMVTMENAPVEPEADNAIAIKLLYNNSPMVEGKQKPAQMYDGLILCTAQKAASNMFSPVYTVSNEAEQTELADGNPIYAEKGMGKKTPGYGTYKSAKTICYGTVPSDAEVVLHIGDGVTYSYFATFEEAVSEINSLGLYKEASAKTKEYEDYTIELLSNVEIGNAKKNNSYSGLSLPTKVKNLTIVGSNENAANYSLYFAGNVSVKSNTTFEDINLYPIKAVKGETVKTAVNYSIGNYSLVMDNVFSADENGTSLIGNVSGSSKTGTFELKANIADGENPEQQESYQVGITQISGLRQIVLNEYTQLQVAKTCNVYEVVFNRNTEDGIPELSVEGAITLTQIVGQDDEEDEQAEETKQYGIIHKPISSKFTLKGAYEKRAGDTVKNYYSIIIPDSNSMIVIDLEGTTCPTGTLILTGSYLDWNIIQDYIAVINTMAPGDYYNCSTYTGGKNLYVGKKV